SMMIFFFSSRRRHTRSKRDWSSDVCSSDLPDRSTGERVQEIEIYLNFIGKFEVPMPEPTPEELAAEEKRRQKRIRDHEKYLRQKERKKKIAEGQIVLGEPYALVCQCCGETFHSIRPNAKFCTPACRQRFYRQQKRELPPPDAVPL